MITIISHNDKIRLRHAFFTRKGGCSKGLYTSLNCGFGSKDDPALVASNRATAMAMISLPPSALITVRQEHTAKVVVVNQPWSHAQAPVADAMVTTQPGVALGILTADCAPVLLYDVIAGVIGAAHAGWRGASGGVVDATVAAMIDLGAEPSHIAAAIGPCIGQASYEVGPEFPTPFMAEDADNITFFVPSSRDGHHMFDLPSYIVRRLAKLGVSNVIRSPDDTARDEDRFFSYRRATLRGEADYARGLSAITLEH